MNMKLFKPDAYFPTIHDINLLALYEQGIRLILTDLDNTLVKYNAPEPTEEIIAFKNEAEKLGMKVVVISNNKEKRVKPFADKLQVEYVSRAKKPFKASYKKFLNEYKRHEIAIIGDQLMTDILGGNRMGFYTILVDVIDRQKEQFGTKINRLFERMIRRKLGLKDDRV